MSSAPNKARLRAVLVGAGAWGKNLLRTMRADPRLDVRAVVDPSEEARAFAASATTDTFGTLDHALEASLDLAVIASPPELHAGQAIRCLDRGLHVLVEKPLALDVDDAEEIVRRANAAGRVAMVGHLLLHHPAVRKLLELTRAGALGEVRYVASSRLSVASRRAPISALWSLGPHDVAVLRALDSSALLEARTFPLTRSTSGVVTALAASFRLASGVGGQFELSMSHAYKERRLVVVGDRGVAVFDDLDVQRMLIVARTPESLAEPSSWPEALLDTSATTVVPIEMREPLVAELDDFVSAILHDRRPRTPVEDGAEVVRFLARAAANELTNPSPPQA